MTETLTELLAKHRQNHNSETGASSCECDAWTGPFTITAGEGSYAQHLTDVIMTRLASVLEDRAARPPYWGPNEQGDHMVDMSLSDYDSILNDVLREMEGLPRPVRERPTRG